MITYKQAKAIASRVNKKANACREFENAYHFYDKDNQEELIPDDDVVILKETGKVVNLTTFILDYHPELTPKEIEI